MERLVLEEDVFGESNSYDIEGQLILLLIHKGTLDWRAWALTSTISFLVLLVFVLILVSCDCWPKFHHRRVKNVDLGARLKINQLVEENWQQLLDLAKEVIDCRLADGIP